MSQSAFMGSSSFLRGQAGVSARLTGPGAASQGHALTVIAAAVPPSGGRRRGDGGRSRQSGSNSSSSSNSRRGKNFEKKSRRKGRPEWQRSPDDSPLRDGNRDRLVGLVTLRAARTLVYYLSETSPVVHNWLNVYMVQNPIPRDGAWDDVSGDTFLRNLLQKPAEIATGNWGRNSMFSSGRGMQVDPRQIAMRIMEIRLQIAKEMTQDLQTMTDENNHLMAETLMNSFSLNLDNVVEHPVDSPVTEAESSVAIAPTPTTLTIVESPPAPESPPAIEIPPEASIQPIVEASSEQSEEPKETEESAKSPQDLSEQKGEQEEEIKKSEDSQKE